MIRLVDLAYACRVYAVTSRFDGSYKVLLNDTESKLDLNNRNHLRALLIWLNAWGCRQFAKNYHEEAMDSITEWASRCEEHLPEVQRTIDELTDADISRMVPAFDALSSKRASYRGSKAVTEGPTGAAKILFATRPNSIAPWDRGIRKALHLDGWGDSFAKHMCDVREQVQRIGQEASSFGIPLDRVPKEVGRPDFTMPKLIDEYNWVTYVARQKAPTKAEISKWYQWY